MRNRTMQNRTNEWRRVEAWKPDEHGVVSLRRTRGGTRPRTAHSAWRAHMMLRGAASCGGQGPLSSTLGVHTRCHWPLQNTSPRSLHSYDLGVLVQQRGAGDLGGDEDATARPLAARGPLQLRRDRLLVVVVEGSVNAGDVGLGEEGGRRGKPRGDADVWVATAARPEVDPRHVDAGCDRRRPSTGRRRGVRVGGGVGGVGGVGGGGGGGNEDEGHQGREPAGHGWRSVWVCAVWVCVWG